MNLNEALPASERIFLSRFIDELNTSNWIDWDKSQDSIYIFDDNVKDLIYEYRADFNAKHADAFSVCLHPKTWEMLTAGGFWPHNITKITIPDGVRTIPENAFKDYASLTSVIIPDSVVEIGDAAFLHCSHLASVHIPNSVTRIGARAFYADWSLASINIPDSVIFIGAGAFGGCTSLAAVKLSNTITSIEGGTFNDCETLAAITIPEGVDKICDYAFLNCFHLVTINIPDSVTYIGSLVFAGCTKLTIKTNNIKIAKMCKASGCKHVELVESLNESCTDYLGNIYAEDIEKASEVFDFKCLTTDDLNEIFNGFYVRLSALKDIKFPAINIANIFDGGDRSHSSLDSTAHKHLLAEMKMQGFEELGKYLFYCALILTVYPELKVITFENLHEDVLITTGAKLDILLKSETFKAWEVDGGAYRIL
jgi:hypothetical protein